MANLPTKKFYFFFLVILLLPLFLFLRPKARAGDIVISLQDKGAYFAELAWEEYPGAADYTVYYDFSGGEGTCSAGPTSVGTDLTYNTGEVLPCGKTVFFIVESDNGGLGSISVETGACSCLAADVNNDCTVGAIDQDLVADRLGETSTCFSAYPAEDVNSDAAIDSTDAALVDSFLGQDCLDCSPDTHTICDGTTCVQQTGSGTNECVEDVDCCECPVDGWVDNNCGEGNCSPGERLQSCNVTDCPTLYQCVEDSTCLGTLRGRIYLDVDQNGSYQASTDTLTEYPGTGCAGASELSAEVIWQGEVNGQTTIDLCDPEPYFSTQLPPGNYQVDLNLPADYAISSGAPLSVSVYSQEETQAWFGVIGGANVSGRVWDNTGHGGSNCSDSGYDGLSRYICASGSGICTWSDSGGNYSLNNIPLDPGGLEVCITPEDGWRTYCASESLVGNCAVLSSFGGDQVVNFGIKQEPAAWFKVSEADMHAKGVFFSFVSSSAQDPYLIYGPNGDPTNGYGVVTAGNIINLNGQAVSPSPRDWYDEWYDFGAEFSEILPVSFDELWAQSQGDPGWWQDLSPNGIYRLEGTIFGGAIHPWYSLTDSGVAIFLARGDVTIYNIEKASWSPPNSHVMLIVDGSVRVSSICDPFSSTDNVDASVIVLDDGSDRGGTLEVDNFDFFLLRQRDRKITFRGNVYAERGVNLPRDRYKIDQNVDPVETFEYQPYLIDFVPDYFKKRRVQWREVP